MEFEFSPCEINHVFGFNFRGSKVIIDLKLILSCFDDLKENGFCL